MMGGLMAIIVGAIAIVFAKFVLPKMNEKMAAKTAEQNAKHAAKKAAKQEAKEATIEK